MSYQQSANQDIPFPTRLPSNLYNQQARTREGSGQTTPFGHPPATQNDQSVSNMSNMFAGLGLPTSNTMNSTSAIGGQPLPVNSSQYYMTSDGQLVLLPSNVYPQQMGANGIVDGTYQNYPAMPYFAQAAYPGYMPGYSMVPYTPGRNSGYYSDRSDQGHKDVPGLENRRGSYSTNESAPGTPFYGTISHPGTTIATTDRSPFGSTPSPQSLTLQHHDQLHSKPLPYKTIPINIDLDALLAQVPAIPRAVPAVFTPRENMRTLDQSLSNPISGNRNVYIRGLHPNTDDETLARYATRFGKVETSKAIIDTSTGACKGFGFAKYCTIRDSELCIRGFYKLGYEVGFARVADPSLDKGGMSNKRQESFNSRLKAEGDESSTNLYVSNLPKNMTESELGAIFMDYTVSSSRILRDSQNNSRGVGFARFESRDICEEIIKNFHGQPIGEEGLLLQVRYADTPAQKDLKRVTTERRQFRTNEYNVGAYGAPLELLNMNPTIASPYSPRSSQLGHNGLSKGNGSWKRDIANNGFSSIPMFKDYDRRVKLSVTHPSPRGKEKTTPTISEDGSNDDGVTVHCDSPAIAIGGGVAVSPTARKS